MSHQHRSPTWLPNSVARAAALNRRRYYEGDPWFIPQLYREESEAKAALEAAQIKFNELRKEAQVKLGQMENKKKGELLRPQIVALYERHGSITAAEPLEHLSDRLYQLRWMNPPSEPDALGNWIAQAEALIRDVQMAVAPLPAAVKDATLAAPTAALTEGLSTLLDRFGDSRKKR
jgi:hypothetical protein